FAFHRVAYRTGTLAATLRRARLLNRGGLDTIHEGVLTLDRENRIAFVNASARELLDLSEDEPLAGRPASEVFRDPRFDVVRAVLLDAPGRRQETLLLSPGGRKLPISIRTSVLVDEFGRSWGGVALIGNRTVYKRMLEAVQAAERLSAVSELGASLAHEIRNPLASIRGSVQELKGRPGVSESDVQLMGIVLRESDRLDRIIKKFLEFARTKRAAMVDVNLRELLEDVALILEKNPLGGKDRVRLEVAGPLSCRGDPDQLRQVFLNLGINALEASHGYAPILLRAFQSETRGPLQFPGGAETPGEEPVRWGATVEIIDKGDGIDSRLRDRIFAPFFTTKPGGTGMGLAIVSRILKEHGAVIELESMPGAGSNFRVWIPAGYEEPSPAPAPRR
ncbi:MAG: ATP-binding protein, partial [Planctomycetota bacterium]